MSTITTTSPTELRERIAVAESIRLTCQPYTFAHEGAALRLQILLRVLQEAEKDESLTLAQILGDDERVDHVGITLAEPVNKRDKTEVPRAAESAFSTEPLSATGDTASTKSITEQEG